MNNVQVNDARILAYRQATTEKDDHSQAVKDLFVELVKILERIKSKPKTSSRKGSLERWEDEEYIYLETDLHSVFDPEIDVNVHNGRVYIRLEREARRAGGSILAAALSEREQETRMRSIMIGWVEFSENGTTFEAILGDDCKWSCQGLPTVAERLNGEFPEVVDAAEERRGHDQLIGCAYRLGGIAWLAAGRLERPIEPG